jgi:hypothetical protein
VTTVRVIVSDELIAAGVRHCPSCCPVGRAVAGLFPGSRRTAVVPIRGSGWHVRVYGPGREYRAARLPGEVCRWLDDYVNGVAVEPMEFDLTLEG